MGIGILSSTITFFLGFIAFDVFKRAEKNGCSESNLYEVHLWKEISFYIFPPITLFWHLPRGIIFVARRFPEFAKWFVAGCWLVAREWGSFCGKFFWKLFLLIHSEMRILCGVDAMIGAVIGYFVGSAAMGALYGGIVGVFNFLVITELCLKRIWRVIPATKQKII